jgi:hypothetical protein
MSQELDTIKPFYVMVVKDGFGGRMVLTRGVPPIVQIGRTAAEITETFSEMFEGGRLNACLHFAAFDPVVVRVENLGTLRREVSLKSVLVVNNLAGSFEGLHLKWPNRFVRSGLRLMATLRQAGHRELSQRSFSSHFHYALPLQESP